MIVLAILTGSSSLYLYSLVYQGTVSIFPAMIVQGILLLITLIAIFSYKGKRTTRSYDGGGYRIWTLRFGIIVLSTLGNVSIFVLYLLNFLEIIQAL
ncbi:hypothetical protein [Vagococcus hydrophili]|uniref:Uncharacterized protein n=1 Tax=Vagococcus hydrophili TaxID=2714947 RepID=A0A6G8ATL8_9ENTE|nr:hypothetical protein [Vagococcus hydrophili]QIL48337.1 hypothetical protein G7082_07435 [Vagococcus hydrophili]